MAEHFPEKCGETVSAENILFPFYIELELNKNCVNALKLKGGDFTYLRQNFHGSVIER
jgi:hypothetical protein